MKLNLKNPIFSLSLSYLMLAGTSIQAWTTPIYTEITEDAGEMVVVTLAPSNPYAKMPWFQFECNNVAYAYMNGSAWLSKGQVVHLVPVDLSEVDAVNEYLNTTPPMYSPQWYSSQYRENRETVSFVWMVLHPESPDSEVILILVIKGPGKQGST